MSSGVDAPDGDRARRRTQQERTQQTQQKLLQATIALLKQRRYVGLRTLQALYRGAEKSCFQAIRSKHSHSAYLKVALLRPVQ